METIIKVALQCLLAYGIFTIFYFIKKSLISKESDKKLEEENDKKEKHSEDKIEYKITTKHLIGAILLVVAFAFIMKCSEDNDRKGSRYDYKKSYTEKSTAANGKDVLMYKFVRDTKKNLPIRVDECTTLVALMYASDVLTMKYEVSDDIVDIIDDEFVDIQKEYLIDSTKEIIKMIGLPRSIKNLTFNYVYYSEYGEFLASIPVKLSEL